MLDGSVRKVGCVAMALALSAGGLGGCQSAPKTDGPDTGLASLGSSGTAGGSSSDTPETNDERIARMAAEAAKDIESLRNPAAIKQNNANSAAQVTKPSPAPRTTKIDAALAPLEIASPDSPAPTTLNPSPDAQIASAKQQPTQATTAPNDALAALPPRDALAVEMGMFVARALRTLKAEPGNEGTIGQLVGILEAIQPGFLVGIEDLQSPTRQAMGEADAVELLAHRHLVPATDVANTPNASPAPETVEVPRVEAPKPVFAVANAHLCSRVTSFGQYEPLEGTTFAADRPIRALVYVEIENFENRETAGGRRLVEVSQKLALYPESGTAEVWSTKEQSVREEGFRSRRDFYLVQQVDLPRNLSLGTYSLKVTVVDKVNGAQAEVSLPIRIVAGDRAASGQ